ncbi:Uncharacterized conserved protein YlxW, UPF0749 family [Clostridium cavendishii DSM 21758]|uniref:Uncharacterized conserved protein YlxW, UPF0749 family n=1 Tax=Clostridium cavendishii DSM 21758 TaxID=1121302 RepID=A0A1M6KP35_9CLOT|nr:DUF881 domain-containing protein [Clostridium cavendishii]SHJ60717.1 Uncharacterized conserved protein YlxW, UPF0749 family [Clostridium cavendishii DSM 21758]
MKNKEVSLFVFIASIIIGLLISFNISLKPSAPKSQLSAKEYQEAVKKKNSLYNDIAKLRENNKNISNKINEYNYSTKKEENLVKAINRELEENKALTGLGAAHGKGIRIIISDSEQKIGSANTDNDEEQALKLVHDNDLLLIMNDIRVARGEAIAINNERLMFNSEIICYGAFVRFNKTTRSPEPYYIDVIGEPEFLKNALLAAGSHLKSLILRGISVEIETHDDIKLEAYKGKIDFNNIIFQK